MRQPIFTKHSALLLAALITASCQPAAPDPPADLDPGFLAAVFKPPAESAIPDGPEGDSIRRGLQLFTQTQTKASAYVGSGLNCSNCHLEAGRKPESSPMWAAWGNYPAYRKKNNMINTMEDRIRGCFIYSMNSSASPSGGPPPPGSDVYKDMESYFSWLATGAPNRTVMDGRGFRKLAATALGHDPARGRQVYQEKCAECHGASGQGTKGADGAYVYPPLWGDHAFNWGAGMGKISNAAGFIKVNMPYGNGDTLTDQQAWDVAAFMDSQERPRDPRQTGTIEENRQQNHQQGDYYGQTISGDLLGDGKP